MSAGQGVHLADLPVDDPSDEDDSYAAFVEREFGIKTRSSRKVPRRKRWVLIVALVLVVVAVLVIGLARQSRSAL